jgi:hypothetical protein
MPHPPYLIAAGKPGVTDHSLSSMFLCVKNSSFPVAQKLKIEVESALFNTEFSVII